MSDVAPWVTDLVDLIYTARMCGAQVNDAVDTAWNECAPDSPKNKAIKKAIARKRVRAAQPVTARTEPGPLQFDGRPHERDWWPLRNGILARDNFTCVYCGDNDDVSPLCADHVVPLSRGGTNEPDNLVCACIPCNSSKNNRLLSEWRGRYR